MKKPESYEIKYELCKELISKSLKQLLGEYIEAKYYDFGYNEILDLKLTNHIDYMMLTIIEEDEKFTLNSFLDSYFHDCDDIINFKKSLNNIVVFEDLIELLILIKASIEADRLEENRYHLNIHLCITYFSQLKKLNELYDFCKNLIVDLQENKINLNQTFNEFSNDNTLQGEKSELFNRIENFQQKASSKKNLINCMDLIFKHHSQFYS